MKVVIYTHEFVPFAGGIATYCYELASGLCLRGNDVVIVTPKKGPVEQDHLPFVIEWVSVGEGTDKRTLMILVLKAIARVLWVILKFQPEVLLVTDVGALRAASILRFLVPTKLVPILHGSEILLEKNRRRGLIAWQMRRFYKSRSLVICVSLYTRALFLNAFPLPPENVVTIHNGMKNRFDRKMHHGDRVREQWNIPSDTSVLLTIARLDPRKGQDVVIRALSHIVEKHPNVIYICAGVGNYRADLSQLAVDHRVEHHVIFPGRISDREKYAYYDACDLFVMPSRRAGNTVEGFGLSFLEAWHASKPVLGGNHGGVLEVIEDGVDGVVVEPEDVDSVADAVVALLGDPSRLREMGRRGNEKACRRFSEVRMADEMLRAIGGGHGR